MLNQQSRMFAVAAALASTVAVIGAPRPPARLTAHETVVATTSFQSRVGRYINLRRGIVADVLRRTPDAGEGDPSVRQAIALGIQQARHNATSGDVISADVVDRVIAAVRFDLSRRNPHDLRSLMSEVPMADSVRVNDRYPEGAPFATMPPLLLQQLEPLPPELQYRFLGTSLILLDVDTGVIVDVVPHVIEGTT